MAKLIVELRRLKQNGWTLPKFRWGGLPRYQGVLVLRDTFLADLNRTTLVASLLCKDTGAKLAEPPDLFDASVLHVTPSEMVVTGLERIFDLGRPFDFAQTWVIRPTELLLDQELD